MAWLLLPTASALLSSRALRPSPSPRVRPARLYIDDATTGRVVALADVHGDYAAMVQVLLAARLIDDRRRWIGGDATLVQLGDILDRGDSERECWDLLQELKAAAPAAGGRVVCLVGNHELMNVGGRASNFIHARGRTAFGPDRTEAWRQGGPLATALAECAVVAIVGDTVFVHAGLPHDLTREGIGELNTEMRRWLLDPRVAPPRWLWGGDPLWGDVSPVWDRSLSSPSGRELPPYTCEEVRLALQRLGVARVVVGHTPQAQINSACGGAVWRCDTGMSRWVVGGPCEALEITASGVRVLGELPTQPVPAVAEEAECDETACDVSYYDVF